MVKVFTGPKLARVLRSHFLIARTIVVLRRDLLALFAVEMLQIFFRDRTCTALVDDLIDDGDIRFREN